MEAPAGDDDDKKKMHFHNFRRPSMIDPCNEIQRISVSTAVAAEGEYRSDGDIHDETSIVGPGVRDRRHSQW